MKCLRGGTYIAHMYSFTTFLNNVTLQNGTCLIADVTDSHLVRIRLVSVRWLRFLVEVCLPER